MGDPENPQGDVGTGEPIGPIHCEQRKWIGPKRVSGRSPAAKRSHISYFSNTICVAICVGV